MKRLVTSLILLVATWPLFSQNLDKAAEWLTRSTEAYRAVETMSVNIEYKVFAGHDNARLLDQMGGILKKSGMNTYSRYANSEIVENDLHIIVINPVTRQIIIRQKTESVFRPVFADAFDSLSSYIDSAVVKETTSEVQLSLWFVDRPGIPYSRADIYISKPTLQASRVNLYFPYPIPMYEETSGYKPGKLEITYSQVALNPEFPADIFQTSTYVKDMGGNRYSGNGKLKDYKVYYMAN